MTRRPPTMIVAALAAGLAAPAAAFHRPSPPVTVITSSGDTDLPRIPSQGRRTLAIVEGQQVVSFLPFSTGALGTLVADSGAAPAVSYTGRTIAWSANDDPLEQGLPGWQIVLSQDGKLTAGAIDPSGTSANPSLDKRGTTLAFESAGDLTGTGTPGVNRVYLRDKTGALGLASTGSGWSGNAMLSAKGGLVAFESTSDPLSGMDTGTTQIWAAQVASLPGQPITAGAGASTAPIVSDDGRLIAFVSRADLAGDGADTGVAQIFVYDTKSETFAQITAEASGCTRPAVAKVVRDWRVTFICNGQAYFHMLRANQRYHVPTPDGLVQSIVPEMGVHFLTLSTTADLMAGSGTTAGHQIYLLNLFKTAVPVVAGSESWFPFQGIPDL